MRRKQNWGETGESRCRCVVLANPSRQLVCVLPLGVLCGFVYFLLTLLGLAAVQGLSLFAASGGSSLAVERRLWRTGSVVVAHGLENAGSAVLAHGLSCPAACVIFLVSCQITCIDR